MTAYTERRSARVIDKYALVASLTPLALRGTLLEELIPSHRV